MAPFAHLPRPRLLACDIDGTILDPDGVLRPEVRYAIALIASTGVEVVLATGRSPWSGVADLSDQLGLLGPQITMQGALLSVPATAEVHWARAIPPALYHAALAFARDNALEPIVALLDGHRARRLPDGAQPFTPPIVEGPRFRRVEALVDLADHPAMRVFLPTDPIRHHALRAAATQHFGAAASVVWSDTSGFEVLAAGTHKGAAIAALAAVRGLGLDDVAAVGDGCNDLEMLALAGRSAAMGSAPAEVLDVADIAVPPASQSGVLEAFAWFFPDLAIRLRGSWWAMMPAPAPRQRETCSVA